MSERDFYLDRSEVERLVERVVRTAQDHGADEAAACLVAGRSSLARFAGGRVIQNLERHSRRLSLAVAVGKHESYVSRNITGLDDIEALVRSCVDVARISPENEEHLDPVSGDEPLRGEGHDSRVATMSPADKAGTIRSVLDLGHRRNLTVSGTYRDDDEIEAVANSAGCLASYAHTHLGFSVTARTEDGTGSAREENFGNYLEDVSPVPLAESAMDRAERSRDPQPIEPGEYTVILSPAAVASYLFFLVTEMDARRAQTGMSAFAGPTSGSTRIGESMFDESVTIERCVTSPGLAVKPYGPASSLEGSEGQGSPLDLFSLGLPVHESAMVRDGILQELVHSYVWAMKQGQTPTGFAGAFRMRGEDRSFEDLIASTKRGILVSNFWYIRMVDRNELTLTGLTRDGTFLVEEGEIRHPVQNLRFNESPLVSLKNIETLSRPQRRDQWGVRFLVPGMVTRNFTFSGTSDAV